MTEFSPASRAAIIEAGGGRCVGCGSPDITVQHRRRRGMGGSKDPLISTPANGLPLCGHGTAGCHGWTEHHPLQSSALGWALRDGEDQLVEPFYSRFGWRLWQVETVPPDARRSVSAPAFYSVAFVFDEDLDRQDERAAAVEAWQGRGDGWRL